MDPKTAKPVMMRFGAIISEKRKLLRMSQEELAERVGISQESLSRMEKGVIAPRFERLQLFAEALECSIADLFRGEEEAGECAYTIERLLSPLPRQAQEEIVGIVATVARLDVPSAHADDSLPHHPPALFRRCPCASTGDSANGARRDRPVPPPLPRGPSCRGFPARGGPPRRPRDASQSYPCGFSHKKA